MGDNRPDILFTENTMLYVELRQLKAQLRVRDEQLRCAREALKFHSLGNNPDREVALKALAEIERMAT